MNSIEQKVETILKSLIRDEIQGLPDHSTRAMEVAVKRLLQVDVEFIKDSSHYYDGLYISEVMARIEGDSYVIKMCYDSGYIICFKA